MGNMTSPILQTYLTPYSLVGYLRSNIQNVYFLPTKCIYEFHKDLKTNIRITHTD